MSNDKNHLIEGDFKYQKLTRNREAAIKKMHYLKLYSNIMYFSDIHFQSISSLPKFISKLVKTKNFKYKYLEKYIVIG